MNINGHLILEFTIHKILESKNFKVIMRLSPIGSITCSIKGPFVRASAAQGEDIYLSQTFYSAANLYPGFNFFMPTFGNRPYLCLTLFSPDISYPSQSLPRI